MQINLSSSYFKVCVPNTLLEGKVKSGSVCLPSCFVVWSWDWSWPDDSIQVWIHTSWIWPEKIRMEKAKLFFAPSTGSQRVGIWSPFFTALAWTAIKGKWPYNYQIVFTVFSLKIILRVETSMNVELFLLLVFSLCCFQNIPCCTWKKKIMYWGNKGKPRPKVKNKQKKPHLSRKRMDLFFLCLL